MAYNVKTVLKLFIIFFLFQAMLSSIIEIYYEVNTNPSNEDKQYISFLTIQSNPSNYWKKESDANPQTLKQDLEEGLNSAGVFDDGILNTFLGIYKITVVALEFVVTLILAILTVPSVIVNILLLNFLGSSSLLTGSVILVDIGFYTFMWYAIFKESK